MISTKQARRQTGAITAIALACIGAPQLAAQSAAAQWVPPVNSTVSYGYYDARYLQSEGVQHLGVDLPAAAGVGVLSPVTGKVVVNKTANSDIMQAYLVVRDSASGAEHVLGHITSDLAAGAKVERGKPIGKVRDWGGNSHVHWGVNTGSIAATLGGGWGWGRAPKTSTSDDAKSRGWLVASNQSVGAEGAAVRPVQAAAAYDTSFTVKGKTILLPEKSKLLPEAPCTTETKARLEPTVGRIAKCIGQVTYGGNTLAAYQNLNRTADRPGAAWLFALGAKVTDLGNMSIKDWVQGTVWNGTNVEFLATNLDAVASSSAANPPYARYRITGTPDNLRLQLISAGPRVAGRTLIERDRAAVAKRQPVLAAAPKSSSGSTAPSGGAWTQVPSKPPQPLATPRVNASGIAGETNQQVACRVAQWSGVAQNLADLFECDSGRAIENVTAGRRFVFNVGRVRFANGKVSSSTLLQPTAVKLRSQSMDGPSKGDNFMLNLISQVHSRMYTISCQFPASRASSLKEGKSVEVFGKLIGFSNDNINLDCS